MRKRRALFCAALACFICLGISCPASASGVLIDDLPIDPWGELGEILGGGGRPEPEPSDLSEPNAAEDPALLSLNDDSTLRYYQFNGTVRFGTTSSSTTVGTSKGTLQNWSSGSASSVGSFTRSGLTIYASCAVNSYMDFWTDCSYPAGSYSSIDLLGGGRIRFAAFAVLSGVGVDLFPNEVLLLINGQPAADSNGEYLSSVSCDSAGNFSFSSFSYTITEDVESIGYRFLFTSSNSKTTTLNTETGQGSNVVFRFYVTDNVAFTLNEVPEEPQEGEYKGLLQTIVGG